MSGGVVQAMLKKLVDAKISQELKKREGAYEMARVESSQNLDKISQEEEKRVEAQNKKFVRSTSDEFVRSSSKVSRQMSEFERLTSPFQTDSSKFFGRQVSPPLLYMDRSSKKTYKEFIEEKRAAQRRFIKQYSERLKQDGSS